MENYMILCEDKYMVKCDRRKSKTRFGYKSSGIIIAFLCLLFLIFVVIFVLFNKNFIDFAKGIDTSWSGNQEMQSLSDEKYTQNTVEGIGEAIYVNVQESESNLYSEMDSEEINIENIDEKKYESLSSKDNYVLASLDTENKYPENWINDFNSKIIELQNIFPNGKYWNHMGQEATNPGKTNNIYSVTDIPCNHYVNGEAYCNAHYGKSDELYPYKATCSQCRGFASLLSDLVFGEEAPVRYFEDYDELRIGDQARIDGDYHSVFIIDKTDEYVIVAECNSDLETCQISWGRKILRENMAGWYISRWGD